MRTLLLLCILMVWSFAGVSDTCSLPLERATVWQVADYLYDNLDYFQFHGISPGRIVDEYCPPNLRNFERDFILRWLEFNYYTLPVKEDVQLLGDTHSKYREKV
jgi:hypothetical protein